MITLGLFASLTAAFAFLCLLINLATFALPVWVALSAFYVSRHFGEGLIGAWIFGLLTGGGVYFLGAFLCASAPWRRLSILIALLFVLPAGLTGYHLGLGLGRLLFVTLPPQQISAVATAVLIFVLSWRQMAASVHFRREPSEASVQENGMPILDAAYTEVVGRPTVSSPHILHGDGRRLPPSRTILID